MKTKLILLILALGVSVCCMGDMKVFASDAEEYITISIDATDDNTELMYAIDSEDPDAFTNSNEFKILAGTSHTIYVKDAAGNITSQQYVPSSATVVGSTSDANKTDQNIDINLKVGENVKNDTASKEYEYLTDSPAETGEGTVYDRTVTDNTINSQKIFYDITTEEGDVFHLLIDQRSGSNNVYLLKQVNNSDLQTLAVDDTGTKKDQEKEESLLEALASEDATETTSAEVKKSGDNSKMIVLLILAAIGVGYYYFKIYKNKKDVEMDLVDARDMDDFETEEEEEVDFEIDEQEKEEYLNHLLEGDDYEGLDEFEDDEMIFQQVEDEPEGAGNEKDEILSEEVEE